MVRGRLRLVVVAVGLAAAAGMVTRLDAPPAASGRLSDAAGRERRDAQALTEEAVALYASGQFARACDRFRAVVERDPASAARRADAARCFETWGWQALAERRAEEAVALFRQALADAPDAPELLRGLGVATVHAGRPVEALRPLEAAAHAEDDPHVRLLLAYLYDRRDEPALAIHHLQAALARDPTQAAARRLLEKIGRERRAEQGFERQAGDGFVVKWPASATDERRRLVRRLLAGTRERLERELGFRASEPVMVVLYADDEFRAVTGATRWASGVFDGKVRLPLGPPEAELERLVRHELTHAAVHEMARGRAPRWLHEGLAQAIEGAEVDPMLRVPASLSVAGVEALVGDADPAHARTGYDISLWIVRDLLDRGGLPRAGQLLARLGAGEPIASAMSRVYGLSLGELEAQWRRVLGG